MTSKMIASILLPVVLQGTFALAQLNPNCAPGGNFNLKYWSLQLPTGSSGSPDTISSSTLQGCSGYENNSVFYTEGGDGALVMKVCGSPSSCGCVTTSNSLHCRTELREVQPSTGSKASWSPLDPVNRLSATLVVPKPDDSTHGTVIGQVHIDETISVKPICELFYNQAGVLTMGVEQTRSGGNEVMTTVGHVPVGTQFSYEIAYEGGVLSVSINGGAAQTLSTYSLNNPNSYFKAGNYNQGSSASEVHFLAINVDHGGGSVSTSTTTHGSTTTTTFVSKTTKTTSSTTTSATSTTTCSWAGHCEGASCSSDNDCSDSLTCNSGICGSGCSWVGHCAGAACSSDNDCSDSLVCDNGKCASS